LRIGMVDRVVSDLAEETRKLARAFADAPAGVIADIKRALNAKHDLRGQMALETENQTRAFSSPEAVERINAFLR